MPEQIPDLEPGAPPASSTSAPSDGRGPRSSALRLTLAIADPSGAPPCPITVRVADVGRCTIADVGRALWPGTHPALPEPIDGLRIDGRPVPGATALTRSGIADGSLLERTLGQPDDSRSRLVVVAGADCGRSWRLSAGTTRLGRAWHCGLRLSDPSVAATHAAVWTEADGSLVIADVGGHTTVDGRPVHDGTPVPVGAVVGIGSVLLQRTTPPRSPAAAPDPPSTPVTPRLPTAPAVGPAPEPPPPSAPDPEPPALGMATLVTPLVIGGVLALAWGPIAALFSALGPALVLGTWIEARRRHRRAVARARADENRALTRYEEARHRHQAASAVRDRRALGTGPDLEERAASGRNGFWAADRPAVTTGWSMCDTGPDPIDLGRESVLVTGPAEQRRALARLMVCQLAVGLPPSRLRLEMDVDAGSGWSWTAWLPHVGAAGDGTRVQIIDRAEPRRAPPAAGALVLAPGVGPDVPAWCSRVVPAERGAESPDGSPISRAGLQAGDASRTARYVSRWRDEAVPESGGSLGIVDLLGIGTSAALGEQWDRCAAPAGLPATLGSRRGAPVSIDLVSDGPHALVAGTTGSGKSELLRTLIISMAASTPPTDLSFVLVDFKGGAAFDGCAALPHVSGLVTDLDGALMDRALMGLTAEVERRERWLRGAGCGDLADAGRLPGRPPRLVLVIDEFAALATAAGDHLDALVDLARRGRSLGMHLVLATQRPGGVVSDQIRANTDLRIALRLVDRSDSVDVVGVPDAATLDPLRPGAAIMTSGGASPSMFQAADPAATRREHDSITVGRSPTRGGRRQAAHLVEVIGDAARAAGLGPSPCPWPPPLPNALEPAEVRRVDGAIGIGLVDDVPGRCHRTLAWEPATGPLCVHGPPRADPGGVLVGATACLLDHGPVAVYVVDGDGTMEPLAGVGCVVSVAPPMAEAIARVTHRLSTTGGRGVALVVHRLDALVAVLDDMAGIRALDALILSLKRLSEAGGAAMVSTDRAGTLPVGLRAAAALRISLHPIAEDDAVAAGFRPRPTQGAPRGRGLTADGSVVQLGRLAIDAFARLPSAGVPHDAPPLCGLPAVLAAAGLPADAIGLVEPGPEPARVTVRPRGRFLVTGPPGSGRSTALRALVRATPGDDPPPLVITAEPGAWEGSRATVTAAADGFRRHPGLVLVDDALEVDDPEGLLADAARGRAAASSLVVALDPIDLRGAPGHWVTHLLPARTGIALDPRSPAEDSLWAVPLPPPSTADSPPGRGMLVDDGRARPIQVGDA